MLQLKSLDQNVPIFKQIDADVSPVVLVAHFRAAFGHPEFKAALARYPSSAVASPHLFTRLAVPNLCVGPQAGGSGLRAGNEMTETEFR